MTESMKIKNLGVPQGKIDAVLDTDAYNEIDDQFAIAYLFRSCEKISVKALYAAPFFNIRSSGPADGMEKSYNEIFRVLELMGERCDVYRGATAYLSDEKTPVVSDAALDLVKRAKEYSPEKPLYVVAIGAITNVASALLLDPTVAENIVVVWLGGHARDYKVNNAEFNLKQDIAAARAVMQSGVPFVQLPCRGVVSAFVANGEMLEKYFIGKGKLADYLAKNTIEKFATEGYWEKCLWDVAAVGWLLNDGERFMRSEVTGVRLPGYNHTYEEHEQKLPMRYVYYVETAELMRDLIRKICE